MLSDSGGKLRARRTCWDAATVAITLCGVLSSACGLHLHAASGGGDDANATWLAPLEAENLAPSPASAAGVLPEAIATVRGMANGLAWAHGRAYLHAPLEKVRAALASPAVTVDRREVASWSVTPAADLFAPVSFRTHNVVRRSLVTIRFEMTWRQGSTADRSCFVARSEKTGGTRFISLLADSVVLEAVDASTTKLEFIRHRRSAVGGAEDAEKFVLDLFGSLKAHVHGQPLPTY